MLSAKRESTYTAKKVEKIKKEVKSQPKESKKDIAMSQYEKQELREMIPQLNLTQ